MTPTERRVHVKSVLLRRNMYQFGQPPSSTQLVGRGSVACGDACVQVTARIWTGRRYSLDAIRRLSGAPYGTPTGAAHLVRALRALGLPFEATHDLGPRDLVGIIAERGPVIILESYAVHPEWWGYTYLGTMASGRDNGYARPLGRSGKTQLTGFTGGHWVLAATVRDDDVYVRDPNHASTLRPERPAWDKVEYRQFARMVRSRIPVSRLVTAIIPTEALDL